MPSRRINSVGTKIFLGCISMTILTLLVGALSQHTQSVLGKSATEVYDKAFVSMNYLRSAHAIVLGVSQNLSFGKTEDAVLIDQLQSALDALDVAHERALSPRGESYTKQLMTDVTDLQARLRGRNDTSLSQNFITVEQHFDLAVETYVGDALRRRMSMHAIVLETKRNMYIALFTSLFAAIIITLWLTRAIVPAIHRAVSVATAIAAGRLNNRIEAQDASETGILLQSLSTMQESISDKIACIESLSAQRASTHAAELASQHSRFEAALNNMTHGLCMFNADGTPSVQNRRFLEMFASEAAPPNVGRLLLDLGLLRPPAVDEGTAGSRTFTCQLQDGRTISVSEEPMDGGGMVATYEDITERRRSEARLFHMARHDALTGLPNRVLFREHVERGTKGVRSGGSLAVLCLDLDRFKDVNDTLGHPVGDALLQAAATRLLETTRRSDTVVRLGGDEFAVIQYSDNPGEEAEVLAQRLIRTLSQPFNIDGHSISIGASIGIAEAVSGTETPDELLKSADLALYLAKVDGRGTFRIFEREMDARLQAKRQLELDLRAAIAQRQFQLFYQPFLDTHDDAIVGFEALIRWPHETRGIVLPSEFIPIAEETGLIVELGVWVLNQACSDALRWPERIKVAINLSPLQFRNPNLVSNVAAALSENGLAASRLELEITESHFLKDTAETLSTLYDLRALGISISMDDFGTGYSSLGYLLRFPFDKIKIDQSFIRNLSEDSDRLAIVNAVVGLGKSLRMTVVAEGVETDEQMKILCQAGCQLMQGYLFSQPMPAEQVSALIGQYNDRPTVSRVAFQLPWRNLSPLVQADQA